MAVSRHGRAMAMVRWHGAPLCSGVGEREQGARVKWEEQQRCTPLAGLVSAYGYHSVHLAYP